MGTKCDADQSEQTRPDGWKYQSRKIGTVPRKSRTYSHQEHNGNRQRHSQFIEVWFSDGQLLFAECLVDQWIDRSNQDRERKSGKEKIVEQWGEYVGRK